MRIVLLVLIGFLSLLLLLTGLYFEYNSNDLAKNMVLEKDVAGLYDFYVNNRLSSEDRPVIGVNDAGITFIVPIDFNDENTGLLLNESIYSINKEWLSTGQGKLMFKYVITSKDIQEKSTRFIKTGSALCSKKDNNELINLHNNLLVAETEEEIMAAAGINKQEFEHCLAKGMKSVLLRDSEEYNRFMFSTPSIVIGIDFRQNTVLPGIPDIDRLNETVRDKQIQIGV